MAARHTMERAEPVVLDSEEWWNIFSWLRRNDFRALQLTSKQLNEIVTHKRFDAAIHRRISGKVSEDDRVFTLLDSYLHRSRFYSGPIVTTALRFITDLRAGIKNQIFNHVIAYELGGFVRTVSLDHDRVWLDVIIQGKNTHVCIKKLWVKLERPSLVDIQNVTHSPDYHGSFRIHQNVDAHGVLENISDGSFLDDCTMTELMRYPMDAATERSSASANIADLRADLIEIQMALKALAPVTGGQHKGEPVATWRFKVTFPGTQLPKWVPCGSAKTVEDLIKIIASRAKLPTNGGITVTYDGAELDPVDEICTVLKNEATLDVINV